MAFALLAASAAAQSPAPPREPLVQQARATVRILPGARVTATEIPDYALLKNKVEQQPDGSRTLSRLVEFP